MSEYGLKIKNYKAATIWGYNNGIRDMYDCSDAMLCNSLFYDFLRKNKINVHKEEATRDIICLNFGFGTRSYEEEIKHLTSQMNKILRDSYLSKEDKDKKIEIINMLVDKVNSNADKYVKYSKDELRKIYYENGVDIIYRDKVKNADGDVEYKENTIHYKMLYRNPSKAKTGDVMFINEKFYDIALSWLTMGLYDVMEENNAKIVEMSAYAPLVTSTIIDKFYLSLDDVLILEDKESTFRTLASIVKTALEYDENGKPHGKKKCVVENEECDVTNVLWDGMALLDSSMFKSGMNGMVLLRNHFFKACALNTNIQKFLLDWCMKNNIDYDTYKIKDMFGYSHKAKDIKMITTDNAVKWKKFSGLMGGSLSKAYMYWKKRVRSDGNIWGIVKTDHVSKLGDVQQMSYQMINTLPCNENEIEEIANTSKSYVESLKKDNHIFEKFLRKNANEINHYEMLADLYRHNNKFEESKYFKDEKNKIISEYVHRLRKGKIVVNGDNLTTFGNPYALLLYSVGENYEDDPTLKQEEGTIQCYTKRFADGEYLAAFRNPHNSSNNLCYLHNVYSRKFEEYFNFSSNILALNCIGTDIQARANGMDFDSDFMFVTNQPDIVRGAKKSYLEFPTVVNNLSESGITYNKTMAEYAKMDSKLAKAQLDIGESSNLAQLAVTYYWTELSKENPDPIKLKELNDNFIILAVLAQVAIDGCKREYEVTARDEINRIKKMECMHPEYKTKNGVEFGKDFPEFMKYTKEIKYTKDGKEREYKDIKKDKDKLNSKINNHLVCPMNYLQNTLNKIHGANRNDTIPTKEFFIYMDGKANHQHLSKIRSIVEEYDKYIRDHIADIDNDETKYIFFEEINGFYNRMSKIKIGNILTINRLIETSLGLERNKRGRTKYEKSTKYTRKMLNMLYRTNKEKFLSCFTK